MKKRIVSIVMALLLSMSEIIFVSAEETANRPDAHEAIVIDKEVFNACDKLTFYAHPDSQAETYANTNKVPFVCLKQCSKAGDLHNETEKGTLS